MTKADFSSSSAMEAPGYLHRDRLQKEAKALSRLHSLPDTPEEWHAQIQRLHQTLRERLHLAERRTGGTLETHGEIAMAGYRILRVSFLSAPDIRVTGNLYIPDGDGPFPAVLNLHGHWSQGKVAAAVQARGHILAQHGIVVLSVDAAGAGERGEKDRVWEYHGGSKAGELFLSGDSLLGFQVRDNMSAIDVLESLPFVNREKIGATGASGGGNQTIWLSALDERVKVAVPVASVGSFEAYVTRRNCMCETLPGGLALAEQWQLLGAIAPRPLLVLNALYDQPAFGLEPLEFTCGQVQKVYELVGAPERFAWRALDMEHGYKPPAMEAMLGWMKHWLGESPSPSPAPVPLPTWSALPEDALLCFPEGQKPASCNYAANRRTLGDSLRPFKYAGERSALAYLIGWQQPIEQEWHAQTTGHSGQWAGSIRSPRDSPISFLSSGNTPESFDQIWLILSPEGRQGAFAKAQWQQATTAGAMAVAADLPGTGTLSWDVEPVEACRFHDSARASLWLGYPLAGEWAECIVALCLALHRQLPQATIQIVAEQEMGLATLLALALHPAKHIKLQEHNCPKSLRDRKIDSLAWVVPGFLRWGDLDTLRALHDRTE